MPIELILSRLMLSNEVQLPNAPLAIAVTDAGRFILVRAVQLSKVSSYISSTPSGIVISFKLLHPSNASASIKVTVFGNSMVSRDVHFLNKPTLIN